MKTTITKSEWHQIVGLIALAHHHCGAIDEIKSALMVITGETNDLGHCGDAVWDKYSNVQTLLKKLGIVVAETGATKSIPICYSTD